MVPKQIQIPSAITDILQNTPLKKYIPPNGVIDPLHPIELINNTIDSAKIDGTATLDALKNFFDPSLLPADDYSAYITLLSELMIFGLISYGAYRIIIKKKYVAN